jgi:uncharacterized protein (DUF1800 family)
MAIDAAIAMNRFGLGAKAQQSVPAKPRQWLLDQLGRFDARPVVIAALPRLPQLTGEFYEYQMESREVRTLRNSETADAAAPLEMIDSQRKGMRRDLRDDYTQAVAARFDAALVSDTDFAERLVHFWSNHFAISVDEQPVIPFAGNYEFDAIRPNILGKFSDLLFASITHPAMLLYLDQAQSVGPGSMVAKRVRKNRNRKIGLNENLAREILELHTLGVRTGYDQSDVTELARALTGLTVPGIGGGQLLERLLGADITPGETLFVEQLHEPGARQIMGRTYAAGGKAQVYAVLSDLAVHPATARHIAAKLAQHFVSDVPPDVLLKRLEENFLKTGGDLASLYQTLVESPEAWPTSWDTGQAKFKSPWEWMVSSLRMVGLESLPDTGPTRAERAAAMFVQLGQPIWRPGSPAGYADQADTWAGGAALMRRVELASEMGRRSAGRLDARQLAPQALPGVLSDNTVEGIARAESPAQGLSLLLVSPEFLRR